MVLWGRSVLGRQKVPRNVQVPPRFFKFRVVSGSLGQIRLGLPKGYVLKGSVEGSSRFHLPHHFFNLSPSSSTLFGIFPQQR